jgi:predicted phosphoribosyltransferase
MRGLLAVALAKRIGQPLTVEVAREVVAECLPDLAVGAVAVERRGDLVFQAEQLGPDPAAGELAAQRLRFLEETLPLAYRPMCSGMNCARLSAPDSC